MRLLLSLHLQEQRESLAQPLADQLENLPRKGVGFFPIQPPTPGLAKSFYLLKSGDGGGGAMLLRMKILTIKYFVKYVRGRDDGDLWMLFNIDSFIRGNTCLLNILTSLTNYKDYLM